MQRYKVIGHCVEHKRGRFIRWIDRTALDITRYYVHGTTIEDEKGELVFLRDIISNHIMTAYSDKRAAEGRIRSLETKLKEL